tara:strand:+ start:965 stop:1366 length:402 start_codon:yes stop_codon:yes gene_type:complete
VGRKWKNHKKLFHDGYYTYVDISFIFLYFFEQFFLLIILSTTGYDPRTVVGLFALAIITTASLQNRAYQSRIDAINEEVVDQDSIIQMMDEDNKEFQEVIENLENKLEKSSIEIKYLRSELFKEAKKNLKKKR